MSPSPRRGHFLPACPRMHHPGTALANWVMELANTMAGGEHTGLALTLGLGALGGLRAVVGHRRFGAERGAKEWDTKSRVRAVARRKRSQDAWAALGLNMATVRRGERRKRDQVLRAAYVGD